MDYYKLDQLNWSRKKHFDFYRKFSEPFFGLTFNVDITALYNRPKGRGDSLFLSYLYCILKSINEIEEFRHRIDGDDVLVFQEVGVSATIARDDKTFGFSYIEYHQDYSKFKELALAEIDRVKSSRDFNPSDNKLDTIHFTAIPWVNFTSISHARHFEFEDSVPKIACGKIVKDGSSVRMPIAVHAHHALLDGLHIGQFQQELEKNVNNL